MTINERFKVDASRSEVSDKMTGKSIRLEPRLMKLLNLLIENRGQTVKRELIIKEIWDDYPGAEEGLNQAISGLRKLLEDDQKKIIETLPKTGYCFHGTIDEADTKRLPGEVIANKHPSRPFKPAYIFAGILVLIAVLFLVRYYQATQASISEQSRLEEARELFKIDSARQAEKSKAAKVKQ